MNPSLPFAYSGLPVGTIHLYMCAVNLYSARFCTSRSVTVQAAPSGFNITDAFTAIDVTQLADAGNVSVMAAGAQALQSLASFADAGTATAAQKAAMQTFIDAKATSMISALAKDVTSLIDDPKTLGQVCVCAWSGLEHSRQLCLVRFTHMPQASLVCCRRWCLRLPLSARPRHRSVPMQRAS